MVAYAELITAKSAATLRDEMIARIPAEFPTTAWAAGDAARTLVAIDVQTLSELYGLVASIGKGWSLDDAEMDWLTLHAWSRYRVARILATFAQHVVRLTVTTSAAVPYTIAPGQLVVARGGVRFRSTNAVNVVLAHGYPQDITVQCETSGTTGNPAPTAIVTPALAGVSMSWQSRSLSAIDTERDPALRQRCRDRWATLAPAGATRATYRYWLTSAVDSGGVPCGITRVAFAAPPGDGTVPIWIAGAAGLVADGQRNAARDYVDERKPFTDTPDIQHATLVTFTLTGTVTFRAGMNSAPRRAAIGAAIDAYFAALAIGSDDEAPVVDEAGIDAAIYNAVPGMLIDVDVTTSPATDRTLASGEVAAVDYSGLAWA